MTSGSFDDLDDYLALPRVSGLAVSADGSRVVVCIAELNTAKTEYVTAVWELDPAGEAPARRLTRGAKGESAPVFAADGDLLFTSVRPTEDDDKPPAALWRLPAEGGEAGLLAELPAGISAVRTARAASAVVIGAPLLPSADTVDDDRRLRKLRKDNKISAILHTGYPVRHWDKDLGPDQTHLFGVAPDGALTDLTREPGPALGDTDFVVSPDGTFAVTSWRVTAPGAALRSVLMRVDLQTGDRSVLAEDLEADLEHPAISPDCTRVAFTRETVSTPEQAPRITLCHLSLDTGEWAELATGWDRWPASVTWTPDGSALLVTADDNGRHPIFAIGLDGGVRQITADDFSYGDVTGAPGGIVYALRTSYAAPPHPVRIDPSGAITALPCVDLPELPGELTEIVASAADGTPVRSWLVLPGSGGQERSDPGIDTGEPAPLLLWIHGGPLGSWNVWSWRWNPWLMAARGYAVLLPDPALSTGYGQQFIQRGWGAWGGPPYEDLMAAVDAAVADPRIDATRTAAMGGSFGGYMANWVAGHTDRFAAIVTHASLWALDQFGPTTDGAYYWAREMTPAMAQANSPHRFVGNITTPMLVIHGDKDYRVPIGEALRLWYELLTESGLPAAADGSTAHRFLYFPSENHWVLSPQHAKIWYQVVTAFLAEHVLGEQVQLPETLG
ncbi:dipeptidyl aminopeptidase/acylaminoacyl peptidase [Mycolicibacterium sp. BK556]|uniref:S9 family peptidase n=1 Tax=unclassified Mycolicibacterium TaxID=2636767 RepID=UPI00161F9320|nr:MULTISPECIES: prolyl oligopeptidase family serine peptidase [unclassified Mycolicibacterium]MBB3603166.1 dipeptidyl aminopeptidase/acylaminoacyl peptidase [Mycolicibacterium sp. BK556]MBB3633361.1 dipeptidyl aminopeptidase/acylaminoacyl peptidase [Mycolicibacterium sp. BK607]MBB3750934.1 dipeptidyl aminopeptidase/acylaminoacyl peptidase [Mycolicibacterium sp. BK634]